MIPRKLNLLITLLTDKHLRCLANTSSWVGKVQGSRKMPSRERLSLVSGGPQSSALVGATDKWTFLSGTSTRLGEEQRWVRSCVVFKSENWWILSPCFGEQTRSFPPKSMGILHLLLFPLSKAQPGLFLSIPGRRHEGQIPSWQELPTETLPSTFSRFRSWSRWPNRCLREISAARSGPQTCVHVHTCVQLFPQKAARGPPH